MAVSNLSCLNHRIVIFRGLTAFNAVGGEKVLCGKFLRKADFLENPIFSLAQPQMTQEARGIF